MTEPMYVKCPRCKSKVLVTPGEPGRCPKCGHEFSAPATAYPPQQAASPGQGSAEEVFRVMSFALLCLVFGVALLYFFGCAEPGLNNDLTRRPYGYEQVVEATKAGFALLVAALFVSTVAICNAINRALRSPR